MTNIKLLNKIASCGTDIFAADKYNVATDAEGAEAIMVRSASMHEMTFEPSLQAIARAGAGVNNIPLDKCADAGIVVFNTPGANANGVKELAIAALLLASRDIVGGIKWANSLETDVAKSVEKGKSSFAGCEIKGKKLGVIGLGAIGGLVANAADDLGMNVIGCDPFMTVNAAWNLDRNVHSAASYEEIFKTCDYITLHVPSTPETKNMINAESLNLMKDGVRIINLSRADLVNAEDIKAAIEVVTTSLRSEEVVRGAVGKHNTIEWLKLLPAHSIIGSIEGERGKNRGICNAPSVRARVILSLSIDTP